MTPGGRTEALLSQLNFHLNHSTNLNECGLETKLCDAMNLIPDFTVLSQPCLPIDNHVGSTMRLPAKMTVVI